MKTIILLLSFLVVSALPAKAQGNYAVTGKVIDDVKKPVVAANVFLLKATDSSLVKAELSGDDGSYKLQPVDAGNYLLRVSSLGTVTATQSISVAASITIPDVVLAASGHQLGEVAVRSQRPLIEAKADKMIVNVANSVINTGSTAMEVLARSPGVTVDQNDNISLKGKQGVTIMIDGKLVPIQGADLAAVLKGMPSNSIDKIELISNPGARYDAAGTGGIINIITRKDNRAGVNGSLTTGYGQGRYGKENAGGNINYRTKKVNLFASYNYSNRGGYNGLELNRRFYDNGQQYNGAYEQENNATINFHSQVASLGMDYTVSPKTTLGVALSGGGNGYTLNGNNHSGILDATATQSGYFNSQTDNTNDWKNYGVNLNARHTFDSAGSTLGVDVDYLRYNSTIEQHLYSQYYHNDGTAMQPDYNLYGTQKGYTDIRSAKVDYSHPFRSGVTLEVGAKTSFTKADNNPLFYDQSSGTNVYDSTKSNHFIYQENINAAYINLSKDWKHWGLQAGLRGEQTIAKGRQVINNDTFSRNYAQLFPSFTLTRHLTDKQDLGLTLSRRIERPSYEQLNPFRNYIDPTSIHEGNPYLNPALTYAIELNHIYAGKFITQLSWSRTTDAITQVILPEANEVTVVSDRNLATNTIYSFTGTYPIQVFKWWNSMNTINVYYTHFQGDLANTPLSDGSPAFTLSTQNSFTLPKGWSAELSGWFQSKQRYGYMTLNPMSGINVGLQKPLLQGKLILKLSGTDLLYHQNPTGSNDYSTYHELFIVRRDTRTANMSLTWRFGKGGQARRHAGSAEEEKARAGGQGQ